MYLLPFMEFYDITANAVKIQLYSGIIAYYLMAYGRSTMKLDVDIEKY